jgi:hypothetical protein
VITRGDDGQDEGTLSAMRLATLTKTLVGMERLGMASPAEWEQQSPMAGVTSMHYSPR